jgi:hypothetical protein
MVPEPQAARRARVVKVKAREVTSPSGDEVGTT